MSCVGDDETAVTVEAGRRNDLSSAVTPERASSSSTLTYEPSPEAIDREAFRIAGPGPYHPWMAERTRLRSRQPGITLTTTKRPTRAGRGIGSG
jgi:hypothetical protein